MKQGPQPRSKCVDRPAAPVQHAIAVQEGDLLKELLATPSVRATPHAVGEVIDENVRETVLLKISSTFPTGR